MDSTRDDAADELLELTGAVRRQLARHVSLGAWAAPGAATAAYTDEQPAEPAIEAAATVVELAATPAIDRAPVAAGGAVDRAPVAAGGAVDRARVAAEPAAGRAIDRAPVTAGGAVDRVPVAAGGAVDRAPIAAERAAGRAVDRAPVAAELATGPAIADVRRAGGSATNDARFDDEAAAMAAAAAMDDAQLGDERMSGFAFEEARAVAPRSQAARGATAAAPRSQAARAAAVPRIEVVPAPAQAPLIVDEASLVPLGRRTLAQIREELGDCKRCKLHTTRRNIVFGVGAEDAPMMFIGEAPGEQEDKRGEPFVGPAGELLDKMIEAMGWTRQSVYIANILKSRPPGNRNPQPDEVAACSPFLDAQIRAIAPRIIVTLGRPAANHVLRNDAPISSLRGRFHDRAGVRVMPTFHPAYLLREPAKKRDTWSDLKQVMTELERLGIAAPHPPRD